MGQSFRNCIFSAYCANMQCDLSCSKNAVSQILLEKSEIGPTNIANSFSINDKQKCHNIIQSSLGRCRTVEVSDTIQFSDTLTYVGICDMHEGHGSNISVYHLKYSKYIQMLRDSWTYGSTTALREMQAFITSSKILVISGLDYVMFKDFECQTLLTIMQDRLKADMSTILVVKSVTELNGQGVFFKSLKGKIKEGLEK